MSRARDLADIISGGFDVPLASLDNVPASNDASALTTGTIPAARLPATLPARDGSALTNLSAANLTGTIPSTSVPNPLPIVNGSNLLALSAANLTGTLPAIDGSALTGISSGATVYEGIANLPTSATEGASAFVRANNIFYVRGNGQWQATSTVGTKPFQQEFLPDSSITSDGSNLGRGVHISSDGQTAAATAYADDNPTNNQGSVNIYQKQSDGTFAFFQRIVASDAQSNDFFGTSVYVSDDGTYLAVGAANEDQNGNNSGAVYIFYRANITSNFAQQAKLDPSDGAFSDEFGTSVALNADATYCVGGAEGEYGTPYQGTDTGAAYVFTRSGTSWTEQAKLNASDLATFDKFGCSVDINDNATYIAVGAEGESRQNNFTSSGLGAVYIFTRSGTTWSQQTKITGTASSPVNSTGEFGSGVCFDGGANTLAVGAHFSDGSISNCGAAYVFTRSGTTWTQQAQLIDDQVSTSTFGADVRMNKDGSVLAVSANQDDGDGANGGAVYVFDRKGDYTQWELRNKLYHYPTDGTIRNSDYLGETVAIDNAGTTIMSGAYSQDQQSSSGGAVYFFTNTFTNTNTTGTGPYGTSISNLNLRRGSVIEEVAGICDGRIVRAESGVYEMPLVTSSQALTTSFAAMTGSEITYSAPAGTKRVKYNLQVKLYAIVNSGISSYKLFVDDVEVTKFRNSRAFNYSTYEHGNLYQDFEWIFDCDGAADAATGTFDGWNGPKTIRMEANEYSSTYQLELHRSGWFGTSGATGDDVLAEPILTITAYA